ncbi:flagellar export chaperone FlgN [Thalassotalea ganghwensis]
MSTEFNGQQALKKQLEQLQQLLSLLDKEREVLTQSAPEKLVELSEQKNNLLVAIESLDKQIEQSVQFRKDKANGLFEQQLAEIEACLLKCKEQNTINGQIIEHSQLAVERMKTSLLQNHNKSSLTYDNKGKTSGGLSSLGIKA